MRGKICGLTHILVVLCCPLVALTGTYTKPMHSKTKGINRWFSSLFSQSPSPVVWSSDDLNSGFGLGVDFLSPSVDEP